MMKILFVNNLSADPFRLVPPNFECDTLSLPPSSVWTLAAEGKADLALIPVAKLAAVAHCMDPIGPYGVACRGTIGSVLLFSSETLSVLASRSAKIHLSPDSATSNLLLQILWRSSFGRKMCQSHLDEAEDAVLLIGDAALKAKLQDTSRTVITDLGKWWFDQTGMSFVFARWMVLRGLSDSQTNDAHSWLGSCVDRAQTIRGLSRLARDATDSGLFEGVSDARKYFSAIVNRFGVHEKRGEAYFLSHLRDDI
jgi:predicted solute-binding protein